MDLAPFFVFDGTNRSPIRIRDEPKNLCTGYKHHIGMRKQGPQYPCFRITFRIKPASKSITGSTASAGSARTEIDGRRHMERMQILLG